MKAQTLLLAIDVGNTTIGIGVFQNQSLLYCWRISTDKNRTADEYAILLKELMSSAGLSLEQVYGAALSSVVPPVTPTLERTLRVYAGVVPLVIGPGTKTGMPIQFYNPREVGADRIVNAVAGLAKYGAPLILIDFGTATTFCAISDKGEYLGGAIAPGIGISTEALFQSASKLPRIDIHRTATIIGKDTISGMQAGIYYGFCGQAERIVRMMKEELASNQNVKVVATGGLADLIAESCEVIDVVDENLTLDGLRLLYEKNVKQE